MNQTTLSRDTKYTREITVAMKRLGHATNADLLSELQKLFPDLSATTVHRSTARLADRGILAIAPPDSQGSMRYDANLKEHDHFICKNCGGIRDIDVAEELIPKISEALGGCKITGQLLIQGSCEKCLIKIGEK